MRRPRARSSRPWAGVPIAAAWVAPSPPARRPLFVARRVAVGRVRLTFRDLGIRLRLGVPDTHVTFLDGPGYAPDTAVSRRNAAK